ncbi:MAG: nucleotide sugar dehydrogenase [Anaerolineae bacterium]|nr:nucleotide sugar dehydrogenase [Anaerolineae bacterium]
MLKNKLIDKFADRSARVGVVGMGYVGLPLAVAFAEVGFEVVGVDVDERKVACLRRGESYIEDVPSAVLAPWVASGHLRASADYGALAAVDAISICVPTPLRKTKDPDISYIIHAAEEIAQLGSGKLIVLESTTYPGTTDEVILPRLTLNGEQVGRDFFLAFSPERIDPGRTDYTMYTTPKVIGGTTPDCLDVALALYGTVVQHPAPVSSTASAEMVKLLENTFRAVNIGLVNEVALMCDKLGLDVWEVIDAAATKPYGFMKFTPGPGLGGHCIPIDPHYLSWKLKTLNYTARFIELAAEVNGYMPEYVVGKVVDALNDVRKAVNGSRVLILGVAYKPNVSDVRESPAMDIIHLLQERGAEVAYCDPYVPDLVHEGLELKATVLSEAILESADCVVIVTNHATFDWQKVSKHARLIVDTRNALLNTSPAATVIRL